MTGDWQDTRGLDLTSILLSLIKTATSKNRHCEQRIVILITFLGLGRGGESKFLRYDEWYWDPLLELIDAIWAQMKTLEKWPTTFGPDYYSYVLCFYHAFQHCFFLVDSGLYRPPSQEPIAKFVFLTFHGMKNDRVSTMITTWLRAQCDPKLKAATKSKSLRKGANTELTMNRSITKQQRLVRGGWAAADTSDKAAYRAVNPAMTYPPMLALGGHPDTQTPGHACIPCACHSAKQTQISGVNFGFLLTNCT